MEPASPTSPLNQTQSKLAMSRNDLVTPPQVFYGLAVPAEEDPELMLLPSNLVQTALAELWLNPTESEITNYCNQVSIPDALTLEQFEELESHFTDSVMTRERIAEDFRILDADNDGKLTKQEVREVLKLASEAEEGEVEMDDDTFELFYNDFDIKKQGYLTEEEFVNAMRLLREHLGEATRAVWKKLRMPGRERLTTEELRELLVTNRLHMLLKYGELPLLPCEVHDILTNQELRRLASPDLLRRLLQHPQLLELLTLEELRELLASDEVRALLSEEEIQNLLAKKEFMVLPETEEQQRTAYVGEYESESNEHMKMWEEGVADAKRRQEEREERERRERARREMEEREERERRARELKKPQKKKTGCCG